MHLSTKEFVDKNTLFLLSLYYKNIDECPISWLKFGLGLGSIFFRAILKEYSDASALCLFLDDLSQATSEFVPLPFHLYCFYMLEI